MYLLENISTPLLLGVDSLFLLYVAAFSLAALGCFVGLLRVSRISDPEVRHGLIGLLVMSGGWASAHVGYLAGPTTEIQHFFYVVGLIVGIGAVGPWLYFCSAYTGRTLHRNQTVRRVSVLVFLSIITVKLTNFAHGWYYSTTPISEPFPHLLVTHGVLHWVVMGGAYALAFIGFFMLFELFLSVDYDVRPVMVLVAITGLPVATDVAGATSDAILELTYSPLGVSVFAVGVMFIYLDLFEQVQIAGTQEEFAIFVDDDDRIQDFSPEAREQFTELTDSRGQPLSAVLPHVAEILESGTATLELRDNGNTRYYHVSVNTPMRTESALGKVVLFSDITEREQYRQELERQNERLEQFASIVSHDLRNPLNVATLRLETLRRELNNHEEDISAASSALERMETMIDDLLNLARQGQPIQDTEEASLSTLATDAWRMVEATDTELTVDSEHLFQADTERVKQLFENLFRNSLDHGGAVSMIRVGELEDGSGFYVEDDGVGIPKDKREQVLEFGYTTDTDGTGFGLAIVAEIVDAHQWTINVTESEDDGARFEVKTRVRQETQTASPQPQPIAQES
jgi:signal transduction histidine kinase